MVRKGAVQEEHVELRRVFLIAWAASVLFGTSACEVLNVPATEEPTEEPAVSTPELAAPPPPPSARTAEQFDTTTNEQRVAAANSDSGGRLLGRTVASLGDVSRAGFWMETPLVDSIRQGRIVYPENGNSVSVELIPIEEGGSRVSLAAFRVLEAPLTDLPEFDVYAVE